MNASGDPYGLTDLYDTHICPVVSIGNAELMGHEIKCQQHQSSPGATGEYVKHAECFRILDSLQQNQNINSKCRRQLLRASYPAPSKFNVRLRIICVEKGILWIIKKR
jgi:hypothetical protein